MVKKVINNNTIKMSKAFSTELRTEKVTSIVTYKTYKFFGFPYRVKIVSNDFKTEPIK